MVAMSFPGGCVAGDPWCTDKAVAIGWLTADGQMEVPWVYTMNDPDADLQPRVRLRSDLTHAWVAWDEQRQPVLGGPVHAEIRVVVFGADEVPASDPITVGEVESYFPNVVAHPFQGGAIVVWAEQRANEDAGDLVVQQLDGRGELMAPQLRTSFPDPDSNGILPAVAVLDHPRGALIGWEADRPGDGTSREHVLAVRLDCVGE